jgi:hypothetical protein
VISPKSVFKKNHSQLHFFERKSSFFEDVSQQKAYPNRIWLFRMRALALRQIELAH